MRTDGLQFQYVKTNKQFVYMKYASFLAHQIGISVVYTSVRLFYEIILSHITARGKDKKEQPHVGRTLIREVIAMFK